MTCTSCGEANRESARFCASCGTPMHLTCGECEATLSPRAKFCDQCGTPVEAAAPAPRAAPAEDEAVRKTITVVFADLVGSTSFQEKVDAETTRAEMAAYQAVAQDVVERHGGTIAKFIGDGVMAVFGVPDVAEDDADRAVRSSVALQAAFAPIAGRIQSAHGVEIGLRIGINSGEIVVAEDDDDMFGDALNTAARIEGQCAPGRVLVGEQTWRLTRSAITYEVLGEVSVKGKEDPVATFQVVEAPDSVDEIQTPFVGRDREIASLIEAVDASIEERSPVLVTVIGSPGVGKTRLAAEARAVAAPHAQTFDLRVDRAATSTFGPIADLVRRVIDIDEAAEPAEVVERISEWIGTDGDASELAPLLATFIGAGPARSTEESFWASRRLIEILAHRRPTLIVVDDIQWAQPLFLDLLDHLVEWVTGPAALICLARPEIREIRPALAETGRRVYDVVSLEGLAAGATAELAAGLLGGDELPPELADRLPESTEGNPLFVRELVRMLVDDGVIEQVAGQWQLAIDADAVEVPPTIQSLLASRVERMPADERRVVELASVVGSEFARGAIAALLPEAERAGLDRLLERLRRKEIIDPTGNYWGEEPILRFHHVLIRDASYRRMLKQRRADLHVAVGEWTADAADRFGGDHEISIGFHYEQAFVLLSELGRADEATDLGRRAASLFRSAADGALAQDDLAAAGSLAGRALACIDGPPPERSALLLIACEAFFSAGNVHAGELHLAELRELVEGDERLTAWADAFEGQRIWATEPDRLAEIQPVVAAAADRLGELGDDAGVAKARFVQAIVLARLGRVGDCESELDAALTAARAADDRRRVTAVLGAAPLAALWGPSPVARAGGRCLDIIRLLRITSASPMVEATSVRCQAVLEAMRGRFEQAGELIGRARETVEELGLRHGILETAMYAGIIELYAEEPAAAEPFLREAYAGLGRLGVGADAGQAAALLSQALLAQGRVDEAAELADESARVAGQNLQTAIASRAAQAQIAVAQGRLDEAAELATAAVEIAATTDLTMDHARAVSALALVHEHQGRSSSAAADAARLFEAKGAHASTLPAPVVSHATAPDDELTNFAIERMRMAARRAEGHDEGPLMIADDFEYVDRRRSGVLTTDRQGLAGLFIEMSDERLQVTITPLAIRGMRYGLALNHQWLRESDIQEAELLVTATDENGFATFTAVYDLDDLRTAITELTRLYVEGEGAEFAEAIMLGARLAEASETKDHEGIIALLTPDAEFVDERIARVAHASGALRDVAAALPSEITYVSRMAAIREDGFIGETVRVWTDEGAVYSDAALCLLLVRDGLISRFEDHRRDALPELLERFERLTSDGPQLTNLAVEAMRAALETIQGDREADPSTRLPTYAMVDKRRAGVMTLDGAGFAAAAVEARAEGVQYTITPIAIRGERVALVQLDQAWTVDDVHESMFALVEVNELGQHERTTFFDIDDLDSALDVQTAAWTAGEAAPYADMLDVINAVRRTFQAGSRGETPADAPISEDASFIDHRSLSVFSAGSLIPEGAAAPEHIDGVVFATSTVERITEHGMVNRIEARARTTGELVGESSITMSVVRDSLVTDMEFFDADQLTVAIARFEELTGPSRELANAAIERGMTAAALISGNDQAAGTFRASDFQMIDRRAGSAVNLDAESIPAFAQQLGADGVTMAMSPLAVRGDRSGLLRVEMTHGDDQPDDAFLVVIELDPAGDTRANVLFDLADIRAALDELNRRFVEGEGAASREVLAVADTMARAKESGDDAVLGPLLADDFVFVDNRTTGGNLNRGQTVDWFRLVGAGESDVSVFVPEYVRVSRDALLVRRLDVETANGRRDEWEMLSLLQVTDGLVTTLEYFDAHDDERAIARFDELTAAATGVQAGGPRNRLTENFGAGLTALQQGQFDEWRPTVHETFTMVDSRQLGTAVWTRDDLEQAFRARLDSSPCYEFSCLATRGDNTALISLTMHLDGFETSQLVVATVDDNEQLVAGASFEPDQSIEAEDLLNEWYAETLDPGRRAAFNAWTATTSAHRTVDLDAMAAVVGDGCLTIDHRPWSFGELDKDGWLERTAAYHDVAPGVSTSAPRIVALNERAVLAEIAAADANADEWSFLNLVASKDGLVDRIEFFAEDALDAAMARFDELSAPLPDNNASELELASGEAASDEGASLSRSNRAMRLAHGVLSALYDDLDPEASLALTHPLERTIDHRSLNPLPEGERAELEAFLRSTLDGVESSDWSLEPVAERGDDHAIARIHVRFLPQAIEREFLYLARIEDDLVVGEMFDVDDLSAALARIEELTSPPSDVAAPSPSNGNTAITAPRGIDSISNLAERMTASFAALVNAGQFDDIAALYSPNFEFVDHRLAGVATTSTVDDVVDAVRSRQEWATRLSVETIAVAGARLSLAQFRFQATDGFESFSFVVTETDTAGLAVANEIYEADDLHAATQALMERWRAGEAAWASATLDAMRRLSDAVRDPDPAAIGNAVTSDFVIVDHRSIGFGTMTSAEYAESLTHVVGLGDWWIHPTRYHRLGHRGTLVRVRSRIPASAGAGIDNGRLVLVFVRDGLAERMEWFDVDDLAAATARYDELTGYIDGAHLPRTSAHRAAERWAVCMRDGELDPTLVSPGVVYESHRPMALLRLEGFSSVAETAKAAAEVSIDLAPTPVAVRGDRCALGHAWNRTPDGFTISSFATCRLDRDGRVDEVHVYGPDQFSDALAKLDELWDSTGEQCHHHVAARLRVSIRDGEYVSNWVRLTERGGVAHVESRDLADAAVAQGHRVVVIVEEQGTWIVEHFDAHALDDAFARFDALTVGPAANAVVAAARSFWHHVLVDGNVDAAIALLSDDYRAIDRRPLVSSPDLDRAGVKEYLKLLARGGAHDNPPSVTSVAVDDDRSALVRLRATNPYLSWENEILQLLALDADGLIRLAVSYSPGQEEDARAALVELAPDARASDDTEGDGLSNAASEWAITTHPHLRDAEVVATGSPAAAMLRTEEPTPKLHVAALDALGDGTISEYEPWEFSDARDDFHERTAVSLTEAEREVQATLLAFGASLADPDAAAEFVSDDFSSLDHRHLGLPVGDTRTLRPYREAVAEAGPALTLTRRVLARNSSTLLVELQEVTDQAEWRMLILMRVAAGKVTSLESWDPDDDAAALARFAEITAEADPA